MCYKKETCFMFSFCGFFFFFFASLEASPFHPRAITSTLNWTEWWVGKGGRKGSQQFLNSFKDKEASRACFQEGRSLCWGLRDDTGVCQDSESSVQREVEVKVIWHFIEWQQDLVLGIWSVTVIKNRVGLRWSVPFQWFQLIKLTKRQGKKGLSASNPRHLA